MLEGTSRCVRGQSHLTSTFKGGRGFEGLEYKTFCWLLTIEVVGGSRNVKMLTVVDGRRGWRV